MVKPGAMGDQGTLDFPDAEGAGDRTVGQGLEQVETAQGPGAVVTSQVLYGFFKLGSQVVA